LDYPPEQGKKKYGKKLLCSKEHAIIRERFPLRLIGPFAITSARRTRTVESHTGNRPQSLPGAAFDIVALAASAGGLTALSHVLAGLPERFPATLVVVQHLDPRHRSLMADILSRRTPLRVKQAEEGEQVAPATVYIAPPNRHLLVNPDGTLSLTQSQLVHFLRPSADLLFESVAASYRERAIAVVLTGTGSDGAMGVQAIKKTGGTVIAQDEATAEFFGMPGAAIQSGSVDFVLPLDEIPTALMTLVMKGEGA
jgi:two-component system chemotaxis response regulator CheB